MIISFVSSGITAIDYQYQQMIALRIFRISTYKYRVRLNASHTSTKS
jgi:hypothetical protein